MRRRRRTGNAAPKKSKKKEDACPATTPYIASSTEPESVVDMSVTAMDSGVESHLNYGHGHHHQPLPSPTITNLHQMTTNGSSKAVGARKRKPTQISKIVDKPCSENENELTDDAPEVDETQEEEDLVVSNHNNNNNNSPPYKKPCLLQVESKKNGMIRSIVTELKSAKEASSKLDLYLTMQQAATPSRGGPTPPTDGSMSEDSLHLQIEEDGDDEREEEVMDFSAQDLQQSRRRQRGNGVAKVSGVPRPKTQNNNAGQKRKKGSHESNSSLLLPRGQRGHDKVDLANIKTLLNNQGHGGHVNGWGRNREEAHEEDEGEEEEGVDLRNILAGNVIVDEEDSELPYRCGACSYASHDKNVLLRHLKTHKGERPFQCRLCFFAFTTKANCERHLRNRHGQIDRNQVRELVVCLPSSSNASESEPETKSGDGAGSLLAIPLAKNATSGGGLVLQPKKPAMLVQPPAGILDFSSTGPAYGGMSIPVPASVMAKSFAAEDDSPLDLSMDAVDLSTKARQNAFTRPNNSLLRPRPLYPAIDGSNHLVTSPYITKREAVLHPQTHIPTPEGQFNPLFANNGYSPFLPHSIRTGDLNGTSVPMTPQFPSVFAFGGGQNPFNPFNLAAPSMEKIMGLSRSKTPPSKLTTGFLTPSPNASFGSRESLSNSVEKEIKVEKLDTKSGSEPKTSSVSSGSPTSSRKRGDAKSGDYQKPKQRRYRTERPFACPHCPARFTLRSNMERHGKHQHPAIWQRSPSNRVINRQQKNQQSPLVGPPTLVHPNKYSGSNGIDGLDFKTGGKGGRNSVTLPLVDGLSVNNVDVRAVIAQQLKRKLSNSNMRKPVSNGHDSGSETESDNNAGSYTYSEGKPDSSDLASVSQLLDRVKNSNIGQFFHGQGNKSVNTGSEDNEEEGSSGESSEEGGDTEDGTEPDTKPVSGREKKKSAYSSAPHKISCPHCSRRFPWTSSLRRHLLTHTGQKPYQCSNCPLLFTTKSNCDRHLARKHNGVAAKSDFGNNSTEEDEDEDDGCEADEDQDQDREEVTQPEKTTPAKEVVTPDNASNSKVTPSSNSSSPEDVAFRCHLCEASAGEREALLTHMEEDHKETFQVLISKGALTSSPPSENSEAELILNDQKEANHRKVVCVFCVRRFWSVEDLRRHIRSHSGERPFSCPHCSRRFTLKHSMLRHLKKHGSVDSQQTPKSRRGAADKTAKPNSKAAESEANNSVNSDDADSDLIGRLLGINDESLVEKLLNKPDAKDAAKLLGLRMGLTRHQNSVTASTN